MSATQLRDRTIAIELETIAARLDQLGALLVRGGFEATMEGLQTLDLSAQELRGLNALLEVADAERLPGAIAGLPLEALQERLQRRLLAA